MNAIDMSGLEICGGDSVKKPKGLTEICSGEIYDWQAPSIKNYLTRLNHGTIIKGKKDVPKMSFVGVRFFHGEFIAFGDSRASVITDGIGREDL